MADERDDDIDREAILARRRRFVALALTGLASTGCKPSPGPEPCLSIAPEPEPAGDGGTDGSAPFVEDPGAPVAEPEAGTPGEAVEPPPQPCLNVVAPTSPKPPPQPCLKKRPTP